jgi:hypothetical protein
MCKICVVNRKLGAELVKPTFLLHTFVVLEICSYYYGCFILFSVENVSDIISEFRTIAMFVII